MNHRRLGLMLSDYTAFLTVYEIHRKHLNEAMFVGDYEEALEFARSKVHAWIDMRAFDMCCQLAFPTDFGKV